MASVMPYPDKLVGLLPEVILPFASTVTDLYVPAVTPVSDKSKVAGPVIVEFAVPLAVIFEPTVKDAIPLPLTPKV